MVALAVGVIVVIALAFTSAAALLLFLTCFCCKLWESEQRQTIFSPNEVEIGTLPPPPPYLQVETTEPKSSRPNHKLTFAEWRLLVFSLIYCLSTGIAYTVYITSIDPIIRSGDMSIFECYSSFKYWSNISFVSIPIGLHDTAGIGTTGLYSWCYDEPLVQSFDKVNS